MAKIARAYQKIFGDDVVAQDNHCQFGSLKAGLAVYTKDPATIQGIAAWGTGWKGATVNNQAPVLQDLNSLCYLLSRQIAYLLQQGIAEWDEDTEYSIGSFCQKGGVIYSSLQNVNINNDVSSSAWWSNLDVAMSWKSTSTYSLNSLVSDPSGTSLYVSLDDDNTNNPLSDATKWKPVLQNGQQTGISAGSGTLDCQLYNTFVKTGSSSATSIGLNNMVDGQTVTVLISSVTSQAAITWKRGTDGAGIADIKWNNAVIPTPTTTASRQDRYVFQKINGVIYGSADMNCY
jgi:hypothetical protein